MDWIVSYLPQVLMAVGVIALIVEVVVLCLPLSSFSLLASRWLLAVFACTWGLD